MSDQLDMPEGGNYSCQNNDCACEVSYPEDMLRLAPNGLPVCIDCWHLAADENACHWSDLPAFEAPQTQKIKELFAELERFKSAQTLGLNDAIEKVRGAGYEVTPINPTPKMIDEGLKRFANVGTPIEERLVLAFRAMIYTAPLRPGPANVKAVADVNES